MDTFREWESIDHQNKLLHDSLYIKKRNGRPKTTWMDGWMDGIRKMIEEMGFTEKDWEGKKTGDRR